MIGLPNAGEPLGATLMHEHLFVRSPGVYEAWPHLWDPDALVEQAVVELTELKAAGIDTLVDLTTVDLGRDIAMVLAVAERSPVRIVPATGVWREPPRLFERLSADRIADLFVRELTEGIGGSGVLAGVIKVATEPAVDPFNEKLLRASARAGARTNKAISTHSDVTTHGGLAQLEIFASEGIDVRRVVIGHSGDSADLDYLQAMLDRGATLGMDRFGLEQFLPDARRVKVVAALCARGYAEQLVLSQDANVFMDTIRAETKRKNMPAWHFQHVPRDIVPALLAAGVTDAAVRKMLVENPARVLLG
jgi:phosphotriesterase-related protein